MRNLRLNIAVNPIDDTISAWVCLRIASLFSIFVYSVPVRIERINLVHGLVADLLRYLLLVTSKIRRFAVFCHQRFRQGSHGSGFRRVNRMIHTSGNFRSIGQKLIHRLLTDKAPERFLVGRIDTYLIRPSRAGQRIANPAIEVSTIRGDSFRSFPLVRLVIKNVNVSSSPCPLHELDDCLIPYN